MTTKARITDRYNEANLECACIIAANPTLYPEGSLMSLWADVVTSRAVDSQDAKAVALFRTADRKAGSMTTVGGLETPSGIQIDRQCV